MICNFKKSYFLNIYLFKLALIFSCFFKHILFKSFFLKKFQKLDKWAYLSKIISSVKSIPFLDGLIFYLDLTDYPDDSVTSLSKSFLSILSDSFPLSSLIIYIDICSEVESEEPSAPFFKLELSFAECYTILKWS